MATWRVVSVDLETGGGGRLVVDLNRRVVVDGGLDLVAAVNWRRT